MRGRVVRHLLIRSGELSSPPRTRSAVGPHPLRIDLDPPFFAPEAILPVGDSNERAKEAADARCERDRVVEATPR
jgi:hypothetical protein